MKSKNAKITLPKLPDGILAEDLVYPKYNTAGYKNRIYKNDFELWYVQSGLHAAWIIPTLLISKGSSSDRTYAIDMQGNQCRVGRGPHVKFQVNVYGTKKNEKRLAPYLQLKGKGMIDANITRDRISTRRAQGSLHRSVSLFNTPWDK